MRGWAGELQSWVASDVTMEKNISREDIKTYLNVSRQVYQKQFVRLGY